jgi:hypothetical protein
MARILGITFGLATHGLFAVTVWDLYWFLKGPEPGELAADYFAWDALLAAQFVLPHSILLTPDVRERLTRVVPAPFYGCFYCVVTCLSLLVMFANWRPSATVVWQLSGIEGTAVIAAFLASWVALFYSLSLTGLGYQTGWTPWWHWLRGRPLPPRCFEPRGAYLWLRHPVYLSFLGLIWFAPVMTADHAVLTGIWTTYIFVGSCLKDRRFSFYLGRRYREYQAAVPGYPGVFAGPLARVTLADPEPMQNQSGQEAEPVVPSRRAA